MCQRPGKLISETHGDRAQTSSATWLLNAVHQHHLTSSNSQVPSNQPGIATPGIATIACQVLFLQKSEGGVVLLTAASQSSARLKLQVCAKASRRSRKPRCPATGLERVESCPVPCPVPLLGFLGLVRVSIQPTKAKIELAGDLRTA